MGTIRVRAISSRRSVVICWSRPMSSRALWIEVLSWAITSLTSADTSVMRRDRMLKSSYLSNSSAPKLADRASGDWPPSPVPVVAGKVKACFSSNVRTVSSIRFLYACTWRANCSRTVNRCSKRLRPMTNSPTRLSSRSRRSRLTRTVPWLSSFEPTGCGSASGSVAAGAGGSAVAGAATGSSSRGGLVSDRVRGSFEGMRRTEQLVDRIRVRRILLHPEQAGRNDFQVLLGFRNEVLQDFSFQVRPEVTVWQRGFFRCRLGAGRRRFELPQQVGVTGFQTLKNGGVFRTFLIDVVDLGSEYRVDGAQDRHVAEPFRPRYSACLFEDPGEDLGQAGAACEPIER